MVTEGGMRFGCRNDSRNITGRVRYRSECTGRNDSTTHVQVHTPKMNKHVEMRSLCKLKEVWLVCQGGCVASVPRWRCGCVLRWKY